MAHDPTLRVFLGFAALALAVLVAYWLVGLTARAFRRVGFTPGEATLIVTLSLIGGLVNLPLFEAGGWRFFINVGGAVVPLLVCTYLLATRRVPVNEALVGVVLVAAVAYLVTDVDPARGVSSPFPLWLLPGVTAFALSAAAFWHERPHAAALAYVAGTLGTLVGADLVRLPEFLLAEPPEENRLSIGGAAVFDMVFLTGILAVGLDAMFLARRREARFAQGMGDMDQEFERWMREKRAQAPPRGGERARERPPRPPRPPVREARPLRAEPTNPLQRLPFKRRGDE